MKLFPMNLYFEKAPHGQWSFGVRYKRWHRKTLLASGLNGIFFNEGGCFLTISYFRKSSPCGRMLRIWVGYGRCRMSFTTRDGFKLGKNA